MNIQKDLFLLVVIFCVCTFVSAQDAGLKEKKIQKLEAEWEELVYQKGGCIGGMQYAHQPLGDEMEEYLVFGMSSWKVFVKQENNHLFEFLISQFSDTTKTKVHTCPFFIATNGEMAVYAIQKITKVNWYDFEDFNSYKDKKTTGSMDQPQMWLRSILTDHRKRKKLIGYYRAYYYK
ncbi:hypothetical protein [Aureicoccus marinus]|uniref:hypothetical protein n=1 Tax=Aureicoccus marinus TaxID=754435 RepID=UPI0011AFF3D6|nr:hypothetical protein [Aureicoccus marinus]